MDDDKKKSVNKNDDNTVEVIFEGTVEIDPSSIQNGGSMSEEPSSFNSDKKNDQSSNKVQDENENDAEPIYDDSDNDAEILNEDPEPQDISDDDFEETGDSSDYSDNSDTIEDETPTSNSSDSASEVEETSSSSSEPESSEESSESSSEKEENVSESNTKNSGESVSESGGETAEDTTPSESSDTATNDTSSNSASDTSTSDSTSDTTPNDTSSSESTSSKPDDSSTNEQPQTTGGKDSGDTVPDKKSEKGDSKDKGNIPDNKNTPNKAADTAKDAAKDAGEKGKDLADKGKELGDKGKELADKGKELGDKAKDLGNKAGNSNLDKAKAAKNVGDAVKKDGLKGLMGADAIRTALEASKDTNVYSKVGNAAVKVLDNLIGREKTDALLDKLGDKVFKITKYVTISALISLIVPITFLVIGIYMIFAPMLDALMNVEQVAINLANSAEKIANLYMNGSFADSKETFYEELDRLGRVYGQDLDASLLLATTFYTDMKNGYQTNYDDVDAVMAIGAAGSGYTTDDEKASYGASFTSLIKSEIDKIETEATGTYDPNSGLMYTVGKVYRLKLLANAMFNQTLFGSASDYNEHEITLEKWIETYGGQYIDALKRMMDDLLAAVGKGTLFSVLTGIPVPFIFSGSEIQDAKVLLNCLFLGALSIKSIDVSGGLGLSQIKIKYYTYKYSEENYRKYLKEEYIKKNPDFAPYISRDKDNNIIEDSIDDIIDEIYEYKDYFDRLFLVQDEDDSENYNNLCIGAIDRTLANALSLPVDINTKNCISFFNNNAYGYTTDGKLHNGIELNKDSTGNKEGDKVYAVMDGGTVKASSADGTMECTGGCIEISYKHSTEGTTPTIYDFSILYKGLSKTSVTLKKNETVKDHQQVGTIGTAAESEGLSVPSLYLEFRKADGTAIDPTNMIVKCSGVVDYPGAVTIKIPQTFKQYHEYSVTCVGADGWHKSGGEANGYLCKEEATSILSPDKEVHDVWVKQGAKYKNGIAVMYVDGVERYLVAVVPREGEKGVGNPGDVLNATLEDGTVLPLVVLDTKGGDKQYEWGHALGDGVDVIEFEVDMYIYNEKKNVAKNWGIDWDPSSPVVKFTNNGNINSGTFDVTSGSAGSTQASGDLKLCDSMFDTKNDDPQKGSGPTTPTISKMCGDTIAEKIWSFLQSKGYTKEATAAIMGIWKWESGGNLYPYVVQNWYTKDTLSKSKDYTKKVDNGQISREEFIKKKLNGGGYGLAQWTWSTRKAGLYDHAKKTGRSIGDLQVQLEFLEIEMSTTFKSSKTKSNMNKASTIEDAGEIFFIQYQVVSKKYFKDHHFSTRMEYAHEFYNDLKDFKCD